MKSYTATASARLDAPAALVYSIIADYHNGHPHILPKPTFFGLQVERGGIGDGTMISFQMRVFGTTQLYRATIAEPHPGRELVEKNMEANGATTTFFVDPIGQASVVTIKTEGTTARGGLLGALEKLISTQFLRRTYARELALLSEVAQQRIQKAGSRATA